MQENARCLRIRQLRWLWEYRLIQWGCDDVPRIPGPNIMDEGKRGAETGFGTVESVADNIRLTILASRRIKGNTEISVFVRRGLIGKSVGFEGG